MCVRVCVYIYTHMYTYVCVYICVGGVGIFMKKRYKKKNSK